MLLAVDIGNTNITLGAFKGEYLIFVSRLATEKSFTSDQYTIWLKGILEINHADTSDFRGAIISSVVPQLTNLFSVSIETLTGVKPLIVGPGVKTGLNILIDDPSTLGADLAAVSVAAKQHYPLPNVVCDLGTASTITVLDRSGSFIGGIIYPGVRTSLNALVDNAALLQSISFDSPKRVIGRNTAECMQSGVIIGAAALLDGMINRVEQELGEKVTAIATGGLSKAIIEYCERDFVYAENLILEGLRLIYEKNRRRL